MNEPVDKEADSQALMELSRQWSDLVASGDMEGAMDYWADDAVMLPPDLPVLYGKAAIREYVTGAAEIPGFRISWEPEKAYISDDGRMAYLIERNVTEFDGEDGNKVIIHGKVVTVWRKDSDGQWRNVVDAWNTAPPPSG
jgi:ketosteroid isomerase-like protein